MLEKSFLAQRFAKLSFGQNSVIGYSVAGEETVCQVPELNVCFDIGRSPHFALTSDIICLTHGHMDHLAGIAYYLSQRYFQGMKAGTILLPRELLRPVEDMLMCWRGIERQNTPFELKPMSPGQTYPVRRDFAIRCFATHHAGPSLGYSLISIREKLKPELLGKPGPELVELRKQGMEIQYRVEVPLVTFMGDTSAGTVFDDPDVVNAEILITECTFFEPLHRGKAKAGRHLHVDQFVEILPKLKCENIVISHVTRRSGIQRARSILRRRVGDEAMKRIHFLMDFDDSVDAGEVEDAGPTSSDTAE